MKFTPVKWTWKYADWVVIVAALVIGFGGFFLPSKDKDVAELARVVKERKAKAADMRAAIAKATAEHEAMTAKQRVELGIVYVPTPVKPVQPVPPAAAPATKPQP